MAGEISTSHPILQALRFLAVWLCDDVKYCETVSYLIVVLDAVCFDFSFYRRSTSLKDSCRQVYNGRVLYHNIKS